jgi:hypothetical protein
MSYPKVLGHIGLFLRTLSLDLASWLIPQASARNLRGKLSNPPTYSFSRFQGYWGGFWCNVCRTMRLDLQVVQEWMGSSLPFCKKDERSSSLTWSESFAPAWPLAMFQQPEASWMPCLYLSPAEIPMASLRIKYLSALRLSSLRLWKYWWIDS